MLQRLARGCVWLLAASAAFVFVYLGVRRVVHPLELDYIEGVMMDHVVRLAAGRPIYVEPTLEFIPLAYMPIFATTGSLLARIFGPHFWEIRLVSFVSMLLLATLVFRIVWVETKNITLGAAGAGLLLMAFGITGGHYDVGRPDSLMLLLVFSGLALLRFTGFWGTIGAAVLMTLAFFTKQHAVWFVIAALVHLAVNDRKRLVVFGPLVVGGCAGGYLLMSTWLGPWFSFFTWEIPSRWSQISKVRILGYLGGGVMGKLGGLAIPTLLALSLPQRPWRGPAAIWTWAGLGGLATGMMATLDPDAFRHVLNPTMAALSVLGPISLHQVAHHIGSWPGSERLARSPVIYLLLCLQFLPLAYPIRDQLPRPRSEEARTELLQRLRSYPGPVLMLYHGFYGWSAGKGTSLHQITLDDVVRARGNRLLAKDPEFFARMFEALRHGPNRPMIVTDVELNRSGSESRALWEAVASSYRLEGDLGWISEKLNPINGNHWTPRLVYVPIDTPGLLAPAALDSAAAPPADSVTRAAAVEGATPVAGLSHR